MLNQRAVSPVVVVTNQSGVARGMFNDAFVGETHRLIDARSSAGGARVDARITIVRIIRTAAVAACARGCDCRKPGRGMIDQAAADLGLDPRAILRRRRHVDSTCSWLGRSARERFSCAPAAALRTGEAPGSRRRGRRGGG